MLRAAEAHAYRRSARPASEDEAHGAKRSKLHRVEDRLARLDAQRAALFHQRMAIAPDVGAHVLVAAVTVDDEIRLDDERRAPDDAHVRNQTPRARARKFRMR